MGATSVPKIRKESVSVPLIRFSAATHNSATFLPHELLRVWQQDSACLLLVRQRFCPHTLYQKNTEERNGPKQTNVHGRQPSLLQAFDKTISKHSEEPVAKTLETKSSRSGCGPSWDLNQPVEEVLLRTSDPNASRRSKPRLARTT